VRREDERQPRTEEPGVELGRREPLHVKDIAVCAGHAREGERVLERLDRQAELRSVETRRAAVRRLVKLVADRRWPFAEPKRRCEQPDVGTGGRERFGERVVVGRGVRGRVGEDDEHRLVEYAARCRCSFAAGTSSMATRYRLDGGASSARCSTWCPRTAPM
jgi:hypothetical protein